ncbi:MAG: hypothetical protein U1E89_07885 [Burkholderiaceae bacterium]
MTAPTVRRRWLLAASLVAVAFGLLTLKEGGTVLFGGREARAAAGQIVPFVLWFNFGAGFAYVVAGVGLWMQRRWALWLAVAIAASTALVFAAFGVHVFAGGAHETRTVIAMTLRTLVWMVLAAIAWQALALRRS